VKKAKKQNEKGSGYKEIKSFRSREVACSFKFLISAGCG